MVTITLDERDRAVLRRLRQSDADIESLAESVGCRRDGLKDRLPELADNGLVQRVDDLSATEQSGNSPDIQREPDDDVYRITANGRRVLASSPAGTMDNRIDTSPAAEDVIRSFDLPPDREEAIRNANAFLHYWGAAFPSEIIDAVYSENPAGFGSDEEWWTECVRDHLAELPTVEPSEMSEQPWRYSGIPIVDEITDDGRDAPADGVTPQPNVKYALEHSQLTESERSAVRAAFAYLVSDGEADAAAIKDEIYPDHHAGYDSADEWWTDCIRDGFDQLPGVERADEPRDGWRYRQVNEGPMSTGPGADVPDGPLGPSDGTDGT